MTFSVTLAYSTTRTIPDVGDQRRTLTIVAADDTASEEKAVSHELVDFSEKRDVVGRRLRLRLKIGPQLLYKASERAWLTAFLSAKHKWAVYGAFKDVANTDNLCKCQLVDPVIRVTVERDLEGWELVSEKCY